MYNKRKHKNLIEERTNYTDIKTSNNECTYYLNKNWKANHYIQTNYFSYFNSRVSNKLEHRLSTFSRSLSIHFLVNSFPGLTVTSCIPTCSKQNMVIHGRGHHFADYIIYGTLISLQKNRFAKIKYIHTRKTLMTRTINYLYTLEMCHPKTP